MFDVLQAIKLFRVHPSHEIQGLDMVKHNEPAYPLGMTFLSGFVCYQVKYQMPTCKTR